MEKNSKSQKLIAAIAIIVGIFLVPIFLIIAILVFLRDFLLCAAIWIGWGIQGKYILFVYSESPNWADYIEQEILPHIQEKSVVLNWSERKQWKPSLATFAFKSFAGKENFNPIAVVFRPLQFNRVFRFYKAFQDYKHGKPEALKELQTNLLRYAE